MEIKRDLYLNRLVARKHNGMVKVVTGMRRSGKSYLMHKLFYDHLISEGIGVDKIIRINLEDRFNLELRDPDALLNYVVSKVSGSGMHYVLLDEVQLVREFEDVLNTLLLRQNLDVYATGSNAKFLSKDVITEFRGRGDEVRIHPLAFAEFMSAWHGDRDSALREYMTYGGLPQLTQMETAEQKEDYLKTQFAHTYISDIKERHNIRLDSDLEELIDVLASGIGSLVNPTKLRNTFLSVKQRRVSCDTLKAYLDQLQDAFLIERAVRYDIKGRRYIDTPSKYYFEDLGLRNARLNFRQGEASHLLENLVYNELRLRGISVDVGEVVVNTKQGSLSQRKTLEVDFVCNRGFDRSYVQCALDVSDSEKLAQELAPLKRVNDGFQKILITAGIAPTYRNDDGILILNLFDFLLNVREVV